VHIVGFIYETVEFSSRVSKIIYVGQKYYTLVNKGLEVNIRDAKVG